MISSKKIDFIAILLIALALVLVVYAMYFSQAALAVSTMGVISYDDSYTVTITEDDYDSDYSENAVEISLNGSTATSSSPNVEIDGSTITILGGGVYVLAGTLNDGSVLVNATDSAEVKLVLNGVHITSSDFSAIYIQQSEKTVISLAAGTENYLTDGSSYSAEKLEDGKPSAVLYSKDDLVINGTGSLIINGNYQDGIKANDTLKITGGNLTISAVDDGINVNDYFIALDVQLNITSGGDGIKCDHENEEKGFIVFEATAISITSEGDGISASSALFMNDTDVQIISGGGSETVQYAGEQMPGAGGRGGRNGFMENQNAQVTADAASTKAIKTGTKLIINGGSFVLDSADDAVHSDGDIIIEDGVFVIATGDDAIHADKNLTLNPERIEISKCYEGLEAAYITINGGDISVISSDDGINATGESSTGGFGNGMMGRQETTEKASAEDMYLTINGGHIYIATSGDGMDSNGSAVMNGGYLEIYGPENGGNGSIDIGDGGYVFIMNGGSLLAVGSSDMAEYPAASSSQNTIVYNLEESYAAGSRISVISSDGSEVLSGSSNKKFNWVCVSTETLTLHETYTLVINGEEIASATAENRVTISGDARLGGQSNTGRKAPDGQRDSDQRSFGKREAR